jgi:Spy/CpxP family protein refolding chaperone
MHGGKGGSGGWMAGLDLTAEQQTKLKALREKSREQVQKLHEAMRVKHEELKTLLTGDGSVDKARSIHKEVQDSKRKMEDLHFESMMELRTLLTPEQRKKLAELMEAHQGGGHGPHHGPGGPMMGFGDDEMP